MRIAIIAFCTLLLNCKAYPQKQECDTVYQIVEEMPKYKNGSNAELIQNITKSLHFGPSCKREELRQITWIVTATGELTDIKAPGLSSVCEKEIADQIKEFKDWTPGRLKGQPVCVKMILSLHIRP